MKKWSVLLLLILSLIFVTSCSTRQEQSATVGAVLTDNQYKKFDRIVKENENFSIEWVDTQGYGGDGAFHLAGKLKCKLQDCSGVDIAIISPERLEAGSKAWYYKETNTTTINPKLYFCDSSKYGWYQNGKSVWCNSTYSYQSNITNQTIFYDIKTITQIGNPYAFITTAKNATVLWNTTSNTSNIVKTDITSKWNYKNRTTPYGNNIYYLQNINLFKGKEYEFELTLNIDKSKLPLKYSVVVGDMATNKIYYVLDPTIINARTWSNNDDFTNGTVVTNLTTSATGITLTPSSTGVNTFIVADDFADGTINASIWVNTNCAEASGVISCGSDQWVRSVDLSASPFNFNSSQNYNLSIKGKNPSANRDCFTLQDDLPAVSADGTCNDPNSVNNDRQGFYLIGSNDNVLLPYKTSFSQDVFSDTTTTFSFNFIHNASGYIILKDGSLVNSTGNNTINNMIYWHIGDSQSGQQGGTIEMDDFYLQSLGTDVAAKTHGEYSDRQGWTPQTGNQISNISITATNSSGGNIRFRYNSTNASVDTSDWTILSNGTSTLTLDLGANNNIFYQFDFNNTGTGKIVSYTISEITTLTINGTVYDKNNQTVANASVFVINEVGNTSVATLYTNATGLFWTNISVASNYTLYAWKNSNTSAGGAIKTHVEVK